MLKLDTSRCALPTGIDDGMNWSSSPAARASAMASSLAYPPMRISVSVPGMAKNPFSSGSVGPAALSGRDAAEDGSDTESRGGRMACPPPGTCTAAGDGNAAGAACAIAAGAGVGAPGADSSASRRFSIFSSVCRRVRISCRNASAESCARAGAATTTAAHANVSTARRITFSMNREQPCQPAPLRLRARTCSATRCCNAGASHMRRAPANRSHAQHRGHTRPGCPPHPGRQEGNSPSARALSNNGQVSTS